MEIDPENFKNGTGYDNRIEPVKRGTKKSHGTQSVHPYKHLENEGTKEHEFHVNWNEEMMCD